MDQQEAFEKLKGRTLFDQNTKELVYFSPDGHVHIIPTDTLNNCKIRSSTSIKVEDGKDEAYYRSEYDKLKAMDVKLKPIPKTNEEKMMKKVYNKLYYLKAKRNVQCVPTTEDISISIV